MSRRPRTSTTTHEVIVASFLVAPILLIIVISSIQPYLDNPTYFEKEFLKHGVKGLYTEEILGSAYHNISLHINSRNTLAPGFFTSDEISHLDDVRELITTMNSIFYSAIFGFWLGLGAVYMFMRKSIIRIFTFALIFSGIGVFFLLSIIVLSNLLFGFDTLFLGFHKLFFDGNYAFDPAVSNMKAMLPDGIFIDIALVIVRDIIIKGAALLMFGLLLRKSTSS